MSKTNYFLSCNKFLKIKKNVERMNSSDIAEHLNVPYYSVLVILKHLLYLKRITKVNRCRYRIINNSEISEEDFNKVEKVYRLKINKIKRNSRNKRKVSNNISKEKIQIPIPMLTKEHHIDVESPDVESPDVENDDLKIIIIKGKSLDMLNFVKGIFE